MVLNDQVNGYLCDFLADLLFVQHIQVNRLDFNATCDMGHIHTLVSTREWIAMLPFTNTFAQKVTGACFSHL